MNQILSITLEGRDGTLPAERFIDTLSKSLAVLRELERSQDLSLSNPSKPTILWDIAKASTNSPLSITLQASQIPAHSDLSRQASIPAVINSYLRGFEQLETGQGIPSDFSPAALKEARALLSLLDRGIARFEFSSPGHAAVFPTLRAAAAIDAHLAQRAAYHLSDTSLEGTLETVTIHDGEAFDIFDQLTGHRIRCILQDGDLNEAIGALGKRVAVSGRAKFSEKGKPVSIEVDSIRILGDASSLPSASDFEGDGKLDITGGMDSALFVRRLRDA